MTRFLWSKPAPRGPAALRASPADVRVIPGRRVSRGPLGLPIYGVATGLAAVLLGGCGPAGPNDITVSAVSTPMTPAEQNAIHAALNSGLAPSSLFSESVGRAACQIHGGGPAPGLQIMGVCATSAAMTADSTWDVTFTEYWNASQFRNGDDPSSGQLMHYWTVRVSQDGQTTLHVEGGNFPPQAAR